MEEKKVKVQFWLTEENKDKFYNEARRLRITQGELFTLMLTDINIKRDYEKLKERIEKLEKEMKLAIGWIEPI